MNSNQLEELNYSEMEQTQGGFFGIVLVAAEVYLTICGVAYVAGYTAGRIEKSLK